MRKVILTLKITILVGVIAYTGTAVSEDVRYWNISFDILDGTPPEHVSLNFYTTDTLQSNAANTFNGYLIDYMTLTGFQGQNAVEGLPPKMFFNKNDNLITPQAGIPVDPGGLAYRVKKTASFINCFMMAD